jgi:hypothetical protein
MKRTFFKLGRVFSVVSRCKEEQFALQVDVTKWISADHQEGPEDWHFAFDSLDEHAPSVAEDDTGTAIEVTSLYPAVADSFHLDSFRQQLANELADAHSASIERGLAITINQVPINFIPQKLFVSDTLSPTFVEKIYRREDLEQKEGEPVRVKLFAGLATRDYHAGGWYIFCNGRLVLKADKTSTTVWGKPHNMRQYHPDFAYFRGFAYFDSSYSTLLPWTTTKTGVDTDSQLYKLVQLEMIEISKPIMGFLSDLAKEPKDDKDDGNAEGVLDNAKAVQVQQIARPSSFIAALPARPQGPPMQWIRYRKPLSSVQKAMSLLHVGTYMAVGERTFDYYMKFEGEE